MCTRCGLFFLSGAAGMHALDQLIFRGSAAFIMILLWTAMAVYAFYRARLYPCTCA